MSSLLLSHSYSENQLKQLRTELFDSAKSAGLVHPKDNLVRRLKRAAVGSPTEPEVYNAHTFIFAQQFLPLAFAVTDMLTDYIFT